ncbi:hypothetical protein [Algoriphagus sediminis]|uniref:Lipoprotein n=1 Tax=Algoriphagus sediminis TaxID=3057113 RepID=A0ABT7YFP8_9BACT|nr:hypothetical protein [Algoriphagus sediminis]MDN3205356.1 hypothetical protein [Algoriphagus sediminis]
MKLIHIIAVLTLLTSCGQVTKKADQESAVANSTEVEQIKLNLPDTTISFMWRDLKYDSTLNDSFSSIFLNMDYINTMTSQEKAAIGYVSTFIGNECWWDGEANDDRSNLDCKIITALGLGYQCSESHLGFLRKWFSTDNEVLAELGDSNCPTTPYTATIQDTFSKIVISTKEDSISVYYEASAVNMREQESWEWSETVHFFATTDNLKLIKKDKSEVKLEKFEMTEE